MYVYAACRVSAGMGRYVSSELVKNQFMVEKSLANRVSSVISPEILLCMGKRMPICDDSPVPLMACVFVLMASVAMRVMMVLFNKKLTCECWFTSEFFRVLLCLLFMCCCVCFLCVVMT